MLRKVGDFQKELADKAGIEDGQTLPLQQSVELNTLAIVLCLDQIIEYLNAKDGVSSEN